MNVVSRGVDIIKNKIVRPLVYYGAVMVPVKNNKVVFDNFAGRGYGCNPKYIAEALHKSKGSGFGLMNCKGRRVAGGNK